VTCLAAPPGTGKTQAVLAHASTLPPIEGRAAPGSRMAISVPTHKLGKQIASKLPGRALRIYSPTSHTQPDGSLTCIYSDSATPLAAGGQSVSKELCDGRGRDPCPERARCPAYAGQEGATDANLVVGVHGLASALSGYAGTSGTLVVDEPGDPLFTERVTLDQLDGAVRYLDQFVTAYAVAIAPALDAWRRWFVAPGSVAEGLTYLRHAVEAYAHEVSPDLLEAAGIEGTAAAVIDAAAAAIRPDARSKAPPIRWSALAVARVNAARAAELGAASRVLDLLWRGLTAVAPAEGLLRTAPYAAALDGEDDDRAAIVVGVNGQLTAALAHAGPVVILDADVALHVPALTKILGWAPPVTALRVPDGAPIARTILAARASRSTWLPRGLPDWAAILPALRWAIAWLAEGGETRSVGLIAPQVFEAAIAHTLAPDDLGPRKAWKACRGTAASLDRARAHLAPILATWRGRYVLGHYQALEGLDHMADCDATLTLMDPRPNLGVERVKAAYLGLDVEGRLDALAGAELGQAHGRLRTVHRTRPGRQLHVGTVAPSGWQGRAVDVRVLPVGRPARAEGAVGAAEVLAARTALGLTAEALAGLLGVSRKTVQRYESGAREVPPDVAAAVRVLCPATETDTSAHVGASDRGFGYTPAVDVTETPIRYSSSERGFGYIEHSPGDTLPDDEPLPSPSRRTVAEEHDGAGWAWLRVDSQRWDS
jgi:transcriptional regulator with XRE-family HTH domain